MKYRFLLLILAPALFLISACQPEPPANTTGLRAVTPLPTLDVQDINALCESVDENWGRDWLTVLNALHALEAQQINNCTGAQALTDQLYGAYIAYGTLLERRGQIPNAIEAYESALTYNFNSPEATRRLSFLQVATATPPPTCTDSVVQEALAALPVYVPSSGNFVAVQNGQLTLNNQPYPVYGVNYYPRDYPNERFLADMDVSSLDLEMELMRASGLNTLRLFIRHEQLFTCFGNGAVPIVDNFQRLDAFIQLAGEYGYKLILVLNTAPDLSDFPIYRSPQHNLAQIAFIADRYSAESAIMAYDVRDSGDNDYTNFTRERVLLWLTDAITAVRQNAPDQLVTAGWDNDSADTAPLVDFVSFQNFGDIDDLRQEIAVLNAATDRPVLLASIGFNTFDMNELLQRQSYQRAFEAAANNGLAGWVVWTAFDYPLTALCDDINDCDIGNGPLNRFC
ncbi:MAG: cellulase family glycosylhydrolase [Aggregatilineales bacterium]